MWTSYYAYDHVKVLDTLSGETILSKMFWLPSTKTLYVVLSADLSKAISLLHITKTCLYNFDPLNLHFYIVKLGFTEVNIIILISAGGGGSNEYQKSMFWAKVWKISDYFYLKLFIFWW